MANRTERDFSPDSRELGRRRFMIAGEHVILRLLAEWDGGLGVEFAEVVRGRARYALARLGFGPSLWGDAFVLE